MIFVVDRDLEYLKLYLFSVVDAFADVLEIGDGLVAIEVFVLIFDFEDEFVGGVLHGDDDPVVLQDHSVDRADHLVHPSYYHKYDAISFISIVTKLGVWLFFDLYN